MAGKYIIRKVKIRGHWKWDGILPKYVKGHTREIRLPLKEGVKKKIRR